MTREQRKRKILKKANQIFIECGFNVKAKDVLNKKFVVSIGNEDEHPRFNRVHSFTIHGDSIWLYPDERLEGYFSVKAMVLESGEKHHGTASDALYIFPNDPDSDVFFDFI